MRGEKLAAQKRALELYQEASEKLTGLEQLKAAKRVTEMTELVAQSESLLPTIGKTAPRTKPATDDLRPGRERHLHLDRAPFVDTAPLSADRFARDGAARPESHIV